MMIVLLRIHPQHHHHHSLHRDPHFHPPDDVLVDDLPKLQLRGHIVVDVVDNPHLVSKFGLKVRNFDKIFDLVDDPHLLKNIERRMIICNGNILFKNIQVWKGTITYG